MRAGVGRGAWKEEHVRHVNFYFNRDGGDAVELPVKESWRDFVTKAEKKAH